MSSNKKKQLVNELNRQMRLLTANSVLFSQLIAEKAGIYSTDNECLDFLLLSGSVTAGKLAEFTGLTTGAITAMIDRLEQAGYVHRQSDKNDRRKVLVIPNIQKIHAEIAPLTISMGKAFEKLSKEFSEKELEVIQTFLLKANKIAPKEITKLKKQ